MEALYRAARFEGLEEPSREDWRRIIADSSSVEWILGWREGVSNIIDGIAEHGGSELIDELIERSLSEGSRYLYIALTPYASPEVRDKYAGYFEADDAYRAAFEERLPDENQ
ncbi:MAG: hypothetical protein U5L08_16405 [Xanthomonadales bacterium]|nr:hypothetical protein [Xanthomonadales bacterium]